MLGFFILSATKGERSTDGSTWLIILGGFETKEVEEQFLARFPKFQRISDEGELQMSYFHKCPSMNRAVAPFAFIQKILNWLRQWNDNEQQVQVSLATHKDSWGQPEYTWTLNIPS